MEASGPYRMRTVARMTGYSPAALRAWEARHGLLRPDRTEGGHRLYTEDDLRVLRRIRALLEAGRSIGEVAAIGREALLAGGAPARAEPAGDASAEPPSSAPRARTALAAASEGGAPAGRGLERLRRALVQGAVDLDDRGIDRALDEAFALVSPEVVIAELIEPAAREIGELWAVGRCSVAGEHLASVCFATRLHELLRVARPPSSEGPVVVCAAFPEEDHATGSLAVAYYLIRAGCRALYLGARVPFEDLERAIAAVAPEAALLSVTRAPIFQAHRPSLLALVDRWQGRARFVVGGLGAPASDEALERRGVTLWPASRPAQDLASHLLAPSGVGSGRLEGTGAD